MQYGQSCTEGAFHSYSSPVIEQNEENDIEEDGCRQVQGQLFETIAEQHSQMVISGKSYGYAGNYDNLDGSSPRETITPAEEAMRLRAYKLKAQEEHERKRKLLFTQKPDDSPRRTGKSPKFRTYRSSDTRKKSFVGFKSNSTYPVIFFAKAGFFFKGFSDIVACFFCGVVHRDWQPNDDPIQIHTLLKQDCPYVLELQNEGIFTSKDIKIENEHDLEDVTAATNKMSISPAASKNLQSTPSETTLYHRLLCKVCISNKLEVTVQPCGHFAMCQSCSQQLIRNNMGCPICRGPIRKIIRTYMD